MESPTFDQWLADRGLNPLKTMVMSREYIELFGEYLDELEVEVPDL